MSDSSEWRSAGMIRVICCPMASSGVYPNMRSALLFQLVMMPSRFLLIMASSDEATIAANRPAISCACSLIFGADDLTALGHRRILDEVLDPLPPSADGRSVAPRIAIVVFARSVI